MLNRTLQRLVLSILILVSSGITAKSEESVRLRKPNFCHLQRRKRGSIQGFIRGLFPASRQLPPPPEGYVYVRKCCGKLALCKEKELVKRGRFSQLSLEDLLHNERIYRERNQSESVIKILERILTLTTDYEKIRKLRFELARLYFSKHDLRKAGSIYTEYYESYPGHPTAEKALWSAIVAKYRWMGRSDCDRAITEELQELVEMYLQKESFTVYRGPVEKIQQLIYRQAFDAEVVIFLHYLKKRKIFAAERRLEQLEKKCAPQVCGCEQELVVLKSLLDRVKQGEHPRKVITRLGREHRALPCFVQGTIIGKGSKREGTLRRKLREYFHPYVEPMSEK